MTPPSRPTREEIKAVVKVRLDNLPLDYLGTGTASQKEQDRDYAADVDALTDDILTLFARRAEGWTPRDWGAVVMRAAEKYGLTEDQAAEIGEAAYEAGRNAKP